MDSRLPVHWAILETVADRVCAWTGHRLCYRWPVSSVLLTAGDHAETFEVAVSVELAERYHAWRGWDRPVWLEIHEEEG